MTTITKDMISYEGYEGDGPVVTVDGARYRVDLEPDTDATPDDADCYDDDAIQAWRDDLWRYVGVIVTPLDVPEDKQFELSDSLWGVDYGSYVWNKGTVHEGPSDDTYICTVHPVPDMIEEVAGKVADWRASEAYKSYALG